MTQNEFNQLDEFDQFDVIDDLGAKVALYREPGGSGHIELNDKIYKCQNRESLIAQAELFFVLLNKEDKTNEQISES